jgi:uncharacterized protein YndB with AHSA1/START domain
MSLPLYVLGAILVFGLMVVSIGYALPQGHVATVEALVSAPPERVFARISDPATYREWRKDLKNVEVLNAQPLTWRETTGRDTITFEVVERRPPERLVVRIADPDLPFGGTWTYELRPEGTGTTLVITERGEVYNPVFRFVSRFFMSQTATMQKFVDALQQAI